METPEDRGRGGTVEAPGMENPGGWSQTIGMDIFWNHSLSVLNVLLHHILFQKGNQRELVHLTSVLLIKIIFA